MKIIDYIKKEKLVSRVIILTLSVFILAINYNVFLLRMNLVVGGTSGLAIVFNKMLGIDSSLFILIANIFLIILSFIFLGKKSTIKTICGAIMFPLMIKFTGPLCDYLITYLTFDNIIITLLLSSLLFGLGSGLVYKTGFTSGGSDVLVQIASKYLHFSTGKCVLVLNALIIIIGGFVFGITNAIYAILILYVSSMVIDKIIIGISDSKMFFIYSSMPEDIKELAFKKLDAGITILDAEGGYSKEKNDIIMCVVPTKDYYLFKELVLEVDPKAFFVISDCYDVTGGVKRKNLPFI